MSEVKNIEKFIKAVAAGDDEEARTQLEITLRKKAKARINKILKAELDK